MTAIPHFSSGRCSADAAALRIGRRLYRRARRPRQVIARYRRRDDGRVSRADVTAHGSSEEDFLLDMTTFAGMPEHTTPLSRYY